MFATLVRVLRLQSSDKIARLDGKTSRLIKLNYGNPCSGAFKQIEKRKLVSSLPFFNLELIKRNWIAFGLRTLHRMIADEKSLFDFLRDPLNAPANSEKFASTELKNCAQKLQLIFNYRD